MGMRTQICFTGERLKEIRELAGHFQGDLAQNLGCDRKTISRWELGRHRVSDIFKRKLVNIYPELVRQ